MVSLLISIALFICSLFLLHNILLFSGGINILKIRATTAIYLNLIGIATGIILTLVLLFLSQKTILSTHNIVAMVFFYITFSPYLITYLADTYNTFALARWTKNREKKEAKFKENMLVTQEEALRTISDVMKNEIGTQISFEGIFHLNSETGYYKIVVYDRKKTLIHTFYVHGASGEIITDKIPS